ncbi:MAG: hypothetical protein Ct9H300mP11_18560 [Chloroflexota bacterium]|nr:MAG: hypothetical protein Ct9H300mP11_18560 [Chloroflexota bacterium]
MVLRKLNGAAKFGADTQLSGMLHGKVLRSPHAHARIKSIDTSKAEALPGVTALVTSKDFPHHRKRNNRPSRGRIAPSRPSNHGRRQSPLQRSRSGGGLSY